MKIWSTTNHTALVVKDYDEAIDFYINKHSGCVAPLIMS